MIDVKSLRIGNTVEAYYGKGWEQASITIQDLMFLESDKLNEDYRPLPLTEELLTERGFVNDSGCWIFGKILLGYITTDEHFEFEYRTPLCEWKSIPIPHLHTLENIYHSITGEELKPIKL